MPLTIPAGMGLAAVRMSAAGDAQPMFFTLGVRTSTGPLNQTHARRVFEAFQGNFKGNIGPEVSFTGCTLYVRQDDGSDVVWEYNASPAIAGTATGPALPNNAAWIVEKNTGRGGRRGRGRMFIPGPPEGQVDAAGVINTTYLAGAQTNINSVFAALPAPAVPDLTSPVIPVLFHGPTTTTTRSAPGANPRVVTVTTGAAGPAPDDITSFTIDPKVGTQRRRLR